MKMYKVLRVKENGDVVSLFLDFNYGELEEIIGKEFVCKNFDEDDVECHDGFYATEIEGLIYSVNRHKDNRVFEVEMSGKYKKFNEYQIRFEKQKITRLLEHEEVKTLIKQQSDKMDWNYYRSVYPINPFKIDAKEVSEDVVGLLKQIKIVKNSMRNSVRDSVWNSVSVSASEYVVNSVWSSVVDSIWDSVYCSVWNSVWISVRNSARNFIGDSTTDSFMAYVGANFTNIKKWDGVEHEEGVYPFQCYVDLQNQGFIHSFDGVTWRLHAGKDAKIVFEIKDCDL